MNYSQPASEPEVPPDAEDEGPSSTLISFAAQLAHELGDMESVRGQLPPWLHASFDLSYSIQSLKLEAEGHEKGRRMRLRVTEELEKREARRLADAEEVKSRESPIRRSLSAELELPDDDQIYAIDKLLPVGGNALFAGRYKAGKTTFNGGLMKSWADGDPFLGRFAVTPDPERPIVTIFNYEMSEGQFRRWLRQQRIRNTDRVHVVHLRGLALPLALSSVREEVASWLRETNTGLWIVDPASRAMAGMGDPSDNKDVNQFTMHLDEIKHMAGVRDLVLNVHMGHAASQEKEAERALGAQAWSAWADALWMLTKDKDDCRWFHAYGRDVDEAKMLVSYDAQDRSIKLVETDPDKIKKDRLTDTVLRVVGENPGCSVRVLRDHARDLADARNGDIDDTTRKLVKEGKIVTQSGPRNAILHFISGDVPPLPG